MKKTFLIIWIIVSPLLFGQISLTKTNNGIIIENSKIKRVIGISENKSIALNSLYFEKESNSKIANSGSEWFSFSINNKTISSNDFAWKFIEVAEREMENFGKEFKLTFTNKKLDGFLLQITIQVFENKNIFREQIVLSSQGSENFNLSKKEGKVYFNFCGLSVATNKTQVEIVEIKMASWNDQLLDTDYSSSFDNKSLENDWRVGRNLEQNYMYHPKELNYSISKGVRNSVKGPFVILNNESNSFWIAYEHGSPDNDAEQDYALINTELKEKRVSMNISLKEGAYYDGQIISDENPYKSLWYTYGFYEGNSLENAKAQIWDYLNYYICENSASRKPMFYYNTWGMQRDESKRGKDIRGILTEEKIRDEIDIASELGVDLFVLDDGWQDKFGDWNPNKERFPNGLQFYVKKCNAKGIVPGIWMAAHATDSSAIITLSHQEWLIREKDGTSIIGQWKKNFFCFDSDYKDYFIEKCKNLIDQGIRYFKWDGVNNYVCSSSEHRHGDKNISSSEREKLLGYKLPLEVADAIKQLKEYQHDVVIEVDVTEPNRSVGLAILSEARYFWMNNGSAWYGDYSTYRAKSMRMITNLFGGFLPPVLQTYANFPMNSAVYQAQRYNVNSSLIGGRGFWGNISRMTQEDRLRVGKLVNKIKLIENDAVNVRPVITGKVGSSPEIYEYINKGKSSGKIIAFSGSALKYNYSISEINSENVLGVLDNSYKVSRDSLLINFEFYFPEDTKDVILLSNNGVGISIVESSSWLDNIEIMNDNSLKFTNGAVGTHSIKWAKVLGEPKVKSDKKIKSRIDLINDEYFIITIITISEFTSITINGEV